MERQNKQAKFTSSYESVESKRKNTMSWHTYMQVFGETTGFTNKLTGEGIHLKINGVDHYYDSFNKDFRKHFGESWRIVYDRNNLQKVLAISTNDKYAFELEEKHQPAMCIADRTPEDVEHLTRVARFNKEIINDIIQERADNMNVLNDFFDEHPQLNDTVAKHLLVDSLGQHKNHKNEQRQLNAQAQAIELKNTRKEQQQKQKTFREQQQEYYSSKIDINQYLK